MIELDYNPHSISNIDLILAELNPDDKIRTKDKIEYYNYICAFDIETSSFYEGEEKRAIMYEWSFAIQGKVIIGRTWNDFLFLLDRIQEHLFTTPSRRLVCFVHNLSYEYQFMRKWIKWNKVFAIDNRKVAYALSEGGIEFRCSYILTNLNLANLAKNLTKYKIEKLIGDLDYQKIRHSNTALTTQEIAYCINDVLIVSAHIQECLLNERNIAELPLTHTGYVRRYFKQNVYPRQQYHKYLQYRRTIEKLTLDVDEYNELRDAFQGGFTHANAINSNKLVHNVTSFDLCSSYPSVLVSEMYPLSKSWIVDVENKKQFEYLLSQYCCIFEAVFINIQHSTMYDDILSKSKCRNIIGGQFNNGRIVLADELTTTITNVDYECLQYFYKWEHCYVKKVRCYKRGYLPTPFIKCLLELYKGKTELKGIKGQEANYQNKKSQCNSVYGMTVTNILHYSYPYDNDIGWKKPEEPNAKKVINKYNKSKNRFLSYAWGVFVTAYARRNLYSAIYTCGLDYIYADTDSVKTFNADKHAQYFENYNKQIEQKLKNACDFHGFDYSMISPKTQDGKNKMLGIWEFDGHYKNFKTLGAKRYLAQYDDDEYLITIAGVGKKSTENYLQKRYKTSEEIFEHFDDTLFIPAEFTNKNTHTYLDDTQAGYVVDYLGNENEYYEKSSIHLEATSYDMMIPDDYIKYCAQVALTGEVEIGEE